MTHLEVDRDELLAEVEHWEEQLRRWKTESLDAASERDSIRERMGAEVLADPDQAEALSASLGQCAATIEVAASAAAAAAPGLDGARRAVLEFDASVYDNKARAARSKLKAHEARKSKILEELFALEGEGEFVQVGACEFAAHLASLPAGVSGTFTNDRAKPWVSYALQATVQRYELKAQYVRDVLAGVDPEMGLELYRASDGSIAGESPSEFYPPCVWGPGAVVPAERYRRRIDAARNALEQHDADMSVDFEAKIGSLEARIKELRAEIGARPRNRQPNSEDQERLSGMRHLIGELEEKRASGPAVRANLAAELEALTGARQVSKV